MFRHAFASRLNSSGADLVSVKELLGHSDIKTTMHYPHTNREAKRRAVARLGVPLVPLPAKKTGETCRQSLQVYGKSGRLEVR